MSAFARDDDPTSILIDDLVKVVYLNGLDNVFFDRAINRIVEDLPNSTSSQAMALCQQFSLDRGPKPVPSTAFSSSILVANSLPTTLPHRGLKPSLGEFPVGSKFCIHCWSWGYTNMHPSDTCAHHLKRLQRVVLMAPTFTPSDVRSLVAGVAPSSTEFWWGQSMWYYDNGASVSIVTQLRYLVDSSILEFPFRVGGIFVGITLTHSGFIPFLPRQIALAYYSAEATTCLIRLSYIHSTGGSYASVGTDQLSVVDPSGRLLDLARLGSNGLPVVSPSIMHLPDLSIHYASAHSSITAE